VAPSRPPAYVCTGKDCRRDERHGALVDELGPATALQPVPCQDICKGPVAGVEVGGRVEWFKRLRKGRHRRAIVALAQGGPGVPEALQDRWVPKRGGKVKR
jgi:hypothetical protein